MHVIVPHISELHVRVAPHVTDEVVVTVEHDTDVQSTVVQSTVPSVIVPLPVDNDEQVILPVVVTDVTFTFPNTI